MRNLNFEMNLESIRYGNNDMDIESNESFFLFPDDFSHFIVYICARLCEVGRERPTASQSFSDTVLILLCYLF